MAKTEPVEGAERKEPAKRPAKKAFKKRGEKRVVHHGVAHIQASFNNTVITLTDTEGNVIAWESAGSAGFKGSRKSTPFAAQVTADAAAKKGMEHGLEKVEVFAKGAVIQREALCLELVDAFGGDDEDRLARTAVDLRIRVCIASDTERSDYSSGDRALGYAA